MPSERHERRVEVIETVALLTGYVHPFAFQWFGLRPDVARRKDPTEVLIGDAKESESSQDSESLWRLYRYLKGVAILDRRIKLVRLLICHDERDANWSDQLTGLVAAAGWDVINEAYTSTLWSGVAITCIAGGVRLLSIDGQHMDQAAMPNSMWQ
jgi:hypothetical protein